jgi:hypothetical protein
MTFTRDLTGPRQRQGIRDVMEGLLAAELVQPSSVLWLLSAWISDIEILDNRTRAFSALRPDWAPTQIRFSQVIEGIADRGGRVAVVLRDADHNESFIHKLKTVQRQQPGRVGIALAPDAHDKSLIGDGYILSGSMNFTQNGLSINDEHVLLRIDREAAANRRLSLHQRWDPLLRWD